MAAAGPFLLDLIGWLVGAAGGVAAAGPFQLDLIDWLVGAAAGVAAAGPFLRLEPRVDTARTRPLCARARACVFGSPTHPLARALARSLTHRLTG